jgi:hypothetical protein
MRRSLLLRLSDPFQQSDVRQGTPASAGVLLFMDLIEGGCGGECMEKQVFLSPAPSRF